MWYTVGIDNTQLLYHKCKHIASVIFVDGRKTQNMEAIEKREVKMPYIEILGVDPFDVEKTFDCGQCFRFDKVEGSSHSSEYAGVAFGRYVSFASDRDKLYIYNCTIEDFENTWRAFLALDTDYNGIDADILAHAGGTVMDKACEYGRGIRILRQDAYEAVISFIISQNNNIPRIKKIIEALSAKAGTSIEPPDEMQGHMSGRSSMCSFPTAEALVALGEEGLFEMKTGFRAKYIYDAASKIADGRLLLTELERSDDTAHCIDTLCTVKGIGLKVASCAALFGMGRYDAFPVDVWMKRVAQKYFAEDTEFSGARFGRYAGIAQQYLFYYERYLGGEK